MPRLSRDEQVELLHQFLQAGEPEALLSVVEIVETQRAGRLRRATAEPRQTAFRYAKEGPTLMVNDPEVLPILPSLNLAETLAFYRDYLGFNGTVFGAQDYLILCRDHMELHFWLCDDRSLCERTAIYIRGGEIDRLYEEFKSKAVPRLSAFRVRPWNMKEFYVHDPHGNLLKFGRIPDAD